VPRLFHLELATDQHTERRQDGVSDGIKGIEPFLAATDEIVLGQSFQVLADVRLVLARSLRELLNIHLATDVQLVEQLKTDGFAEQMEAPGHLFEKGRRNELIGHSNSLFDETGPTVYVQRVE